MRTGLYSAKKEGNESTFIYKDDAPKYVGLIHFNMYAGIYLYDLYKEYYNELPQKYDSLPDQIVHFLLNQAPYKQENYKSFAENWKSEFLKSKNNDENIEEFLQTISTVYLVKVLPADCIKTWGGKIKLSNKSFEYIKIIIHPGVVDFPQDDPMHCKLWSPSRGKFITTLPSCMPNFTKYEEKVARCKVLLGKAPIIGGMLIGALAVFGAYYFLRGSEPKEAVVEETSSALPFRLITEDHLSSDGYLKFVADTVGEFGYKILKDDAWPLTSWPAEYEKVDVSVTLRPQKSMRIAVFGQTDKDNFAVQEFNFDYPEFVEAAILSDRHEFLGPLLNNTGTHPLTIDYGGGIVESGEEINDDVLRTRVRRDLTVDSVAPYWYDPDLTSVVYSPLKYIRLKRRN